MRERHQVSVVKYASRVDVVPRETFEVVVARSVSRILVSEPALAAIDAHRGPVARSTFLLSIAQDYLDYGLKIALCDVPDVAAAAIACAVPERLMIRVRERHGLDSPQAFLRGVAERYANERRNDQPSPQPVPSRVVAHYSESSAETGPALPHDDAAVVDDPGESVAPASTEMAVADAPESDAVAVPPEPDEAAPGVAQVEHAQDLEEDPMDRSRTRHADQRPVADIVHRPVGATVSTLNDLLLRMRAGKRLWPAVISVPTMDTYGVDAVEEAIADLPTGDAVRIALGLEDDSVEGLDLDECTAAIQRVVAVVADADGQYEIATTTIDVVIGDDDDDDGDEEADEGDDDEEEAEDPGEEEEGENGEEEEEEEDEEDEEDDTDEPPRRVAIVLITRLRGRKRDTDAAHER